jgi:deoxycytidine triphosphate deaminase
VTTLDKNTIDSYIKLKKLVFDPKIGPDQKQPNSVDLRLGFEFYIPKMWELNKGGREIIKVDVHKEADNYEKIVLKKGQYFEVAPEEVALCTTLERIELKTYDIMGVLYPRSSINRRGLAVDLTGIIDTGYCGNLMIPIKNKTQSQIIRIYPGERFVQLVFHMLTMPLTKEEAMKHGTSKPKYHQKKGDTFNQYKPDKN